MPKHNQPQTKSEPGRRVTMEDIAVALGVSKMAVSRALRGLPSCGRELRERVAAKAAELGYRPDPLQSLHMARLRGRGGEAGTVIALLDLLTPPGAKSLAVSSPMVAGMVRRAEALGIGTEVFSLLPMGIGLERFRQVLAARNIHGLIILPLPFTHTVLEFDFAGISAAGVSYSLEAPALDRVAHDHYGAMWEAMALFERRGRRRVGLALSEAVDDRVGRRWHAAYYEYCRGHAGMKAAPTFGMPDEWALHRAGEIDAGALGAWIAKHRIEVVCGLSPLLIPAIEAAGCAGPGGVAYFDLDTFPGKGGIPHEGIDQCYDELGAAAVDVVVGKWARQEYGVPSRPKKILLPGGIVADEATVMIRRVRPVAV